MTIQELMDKFNLIQELAKDTGSETKYDERNLNAIIQICDSALIDYQIERGLKKHEKSDRERA